MMEGREKVGVSGGVNVRGVEHLPMSLTAVDAMAAAREKEVRTREVSEI
jgi:hypothetical protein